MRKKITAFLINAELIIMSLIVIVPVMWIILSSFQRGSGPSTSINLAGITLDNYRRLFSETNYATWFFNTLKIAIASTFFSLILIMLTSWIMSRFKFK